MDLLIKNMEMPKERKMFVIETDGSVWEQIADTSYFCTGYKAVELPPHGELCDKDKLREATKDTEIRNSRGEIYPIGKAIAKMIDEAPTVLEAST